ncbi:hypothetical protein [Methanobacterium sp. MBAC-LM]|uniref:hypothetical protein n=1 Tax=Methanobacterium sp. MBAC-LM TaxID=3412034 RepID=UPI003C73175C
MFDEQISFNNYRTFFSIATRNLSKIHSLIEKRDQRCKIPKFSDDDIDFVCKINALIQQSTMITVIFSVMTIESFINDYGMNYFSGAYFKNYLDKLDLKSKWVIFPKLITNKPINTDSQAFELLGKLIKLRNKLVHDKPIKRMFNDLEGLENVTESQAKDSINAVKELINELAKLDQTINLEWLDEVEFDPFI